jgi:peptidoglycan/xylan/chitin deacetylase (PgdA/CDA1 family)
MLRLRSVRLGTTLLVALGLLFACIQAPQVSDPRVRQSVRTCWNTSPQVWLTFDDYGSPAQVNRILDVLRSSNVKARFFPIGNWARANPGLMARIRTNGHVFGNHTDSHPDLTRISDAAVRQQISGGVTQAPDGVKLLRPPYGAGAFTQRLNNLASEYNDRICFWTVDTRDWEGPSAATIVHRVRYGDNVTPPVFASGVVLMHMHGANTGAALPGVISAVRARGLTLPRLR